MRVHKTSQSIGYSLNRYWWRRQAYLTLTGYLLIDLKTQQSLPDKLLWDQTYKELQKIQKGLVFDRGKAKTRAEFFVGGYAYAYDEATRETTISISVGSLKKTAQVFGDRCWITSGPYSRQSSALPFKHIALSWTNSFGGADFDLNRQGKGLAMDDQQLWPLPNIEDPKQLLSQAGQKVYPTGFLPLSSTSKDRLKQLGTFDEAWAKQAWPFLPDDHDPRYWNSAPVDQQQTPFWRGDEKISCAHMHPTLREQHYSLAGHKVRCFYQRKNGVPQEMPLNFDTIWVFPHLEQALLMWHGTIPVVDETAVDIEALLLVEENRQTGTLSEADYAEQLKDKIHRKPPPVLMPEPFVGPPKPIKPSPELEKHLAATFSKVGAAAINLSAGREMAKKSLADALAKLSPEQQALFYAAKTMPPDFSVYDPKLTLPENMGKIAKVIEQKLSPDAAEKFRTATSQKLPPPDFEGELEKLKKIIANHPDSEKLAEPLVKLQKGLERAKANYEYSQTVVNRPVKVPLTLEEKIAKATQEKSFEHMQISDKTFEGVLFDNTLFKNVVFKQCRFNHCIFKNTIAIDLQFDDCQLEHSQFSQAQFTALTVNKTVLNDCHLTDTQFNTLTLTESQWQRCHLTTVNFQQSLWQNSEWQDCHFSHCQIQHSHFKACQQQQVIWQECRIKSMHYDGLTASHVEFNHGEVNTLSFADSTLSHFSGNHCQGTAVNFTDCQVDQVALKKVTMPLMRFKNCRLSHWQIIDSDLPKFSCQDCALQNIEVEHSNLEKSRFQRLTLADYVSFLKVNLQKTSFTHTSWQQISIERSDLTKSVWDRCQIQSGSFKANMANFSRYFDCLFNNSLITNSNYMNGGFKRSTFKQSEISECNLMQVSFYHATSDRLRLKNCLLPDPLPIGFWERWREVKDDE